MRESSLRIAGLKRRIERLAQPGQAAGGRAFAATGDARIDAVLGSGLARGKLHEIVAAEAADAGSAAGFAAMCARLIDGPLAWLCVEDAHRALHPLGLHEIGIDPRHCLFVAAPDPPALLRAADEALRCNALAAVVIELWRDPRRIDLTVSRRLLLDAERSGVTAFLLRIAVAPMPSAAQTRWAVTAAPSRPLAADAPGYPTLDLELLRQRGGPAGLRWRVEWNREDAKFRAPVSGAVAAVPVGRPADDARRRGTG